MAKHVLEEAKRCLQCKNPKCKAGCPVRTPFNEVVELLLSGKIEDAGEKLFLNNPLSVICSLVCPHEKMCEGNCILNFKGDPIQVSSIEHYISDYYLNTINYKPEKDKRKKVAIIGSGPAGITIAVLLSMKGFDITIFEAHDKIGGVLRYGIPEYRLPKEILERISDKLISMGVKIRPNILIGPTLTLEDLFRDGYMAIFIGTGVWNPKKLNIKGESLGHVHYAIDYLKNPNAYKLGNKVAVLGAGNSAIDVARTALRNGSHDVSIIYRKGPDDVPASKSEIEYSILDGVKFEYYKSPIKITDDGVICSGIKRVEENGDVKFENIEGSEHLIEADSVIIAIGQGPRTNIVSNTTGLDLGVKGLIVDECGQTTKEGVFASGDVVTGAKTVVEAVKFSKITAGCIEKFVNDKLKANE